MKLSRRQRLAITCVTLPFALLLGWFWNPFGPDEADGIGRVDRRPSLG